MSDPTDSLAGKAQLRLVPDAALNAEAAPHLLDAPLTPLSAFFVRNNGTLPQIGTRELAEWRLVVDGEVERPLALSLEDLVRRFEQVTVTAVLECAGNGRSGFSPATDGLPWGLGAVACARWTGVRMRDVLQAAGLKHSAIYVGHESPDRAIGAPATHAISRGLPIDKATAEETLIALRMNDAPLPLIHGAPLRVVAPGYPGSAWQKWLTRLWVREREHDGAKMTGTDYRLPRRPVVPGEAINPADLEVITDLRVRAMITAPYEGFTVRTGQAIEVRGHAWSGHTPLARVDVSADGGTTWQVAELETSSERFAWRRFRASLPAGAPGAIDIIARATDAKGTAQPLGAAPWNPRGYCNNGVQRLRGRVLA